MTSNFGMVQIDYSKLGKLNRWRKRRIRRIVREQRWERRLRKIWDWLTEEV